MTATARATRPQHHRSYRSAPKRRIQAMPAQRSDRRIIASMLGIVAFVVALIVSAILINTLSAVESYRIHDLQRELTTIRLDNQSLRTRVNEAASPDKLREVAAEQGMVPAGETGYVSVEAGTIEGGQAAEAPEEHSGDGAKSGQAAQDAPQ